MSGRGPQRGEFTLRPRVDPTGHHEAVRVAGVSEFVHHRECLSKALTPAVLAHHEKVRGIGRSDVTGAKGRVDTQAGDPHPVRLEAEQSDAFVRRVLRDGDDGRGSPVAGPEASPAPPEHRLIRGVDDEGNDVEEGLHPRRPDAAGGVEGRIVEHRSGRAASPYLYGHSQGVLNDLRARAGEEPVHRKASHAGRKGDAWAAQRTHVHIVAFGQRSQQIPGVGGDATPRGDRRQRLRVNDDRRDQSGRRGQACVGPA